MCLFSNQNRVTITITAGKKFLNMGFLSSAISFTQEDDGYITIGKLPSKYEILDFYKDTLWDECLNWLLD